MTSTKLLTMAGRALWAAWPCLSLSGVFVITWIQPYTFGVNTIDRLSYVLGMELFAIHSFLFVMGAWSAESEKQRIGCLTLVLFLYLPIIVGISVFYGGVWPLCAFLGLTLERIRHFSAARQNKEELGQMGVTWVVSFALFLTLAYLTLLLPNIPLGATPEVIAKLHLTFDNYDGFRMLAWGASYYFGLALWLARCAIKSPETAESARGPVDTVDTGDTS